MNDEGRLALELLHRLDRLPGPRHMEFPDGFDNQRAKDRATALSERLERDFGSPCPVGGMQDAAAYFTVSVPPEVTEARWPIRVWLSNHGDLASISPPSGFPDRVSAGLTEGTVAEADGLRLEAALSDLEYVRVPHHLLKRDYDGAHTDWAWVGNPNWWIRFFYHL
ncbi:hypothetical protein J7F03_27875 [Streptomyces sp. ISL-43]|uniref:hypothetical protein n=1 Tax=Streptomyces sp. ISL-43 TaxID=2819183 RepID=UPI001BE73C2B|nr:hypothetical protein [Streptomyces sp. ISL-43]MBT2450824.1 hypothetical protein [Streptomyces sp. ISL-43]